MSAWALGACAAAIACDVSPLALFEASEIVEIWIDHYSGPASASPLHGRLHRTGGTIE